MRTFLRNNFRVEVIAFRIITDDQTRASWTYIQPDVRINGTCVLNLFF